MSILFLELYGMFLCGNILHFLKKWREAYQSKAKFDWVFNIVSFIMSTIIGVIFVYSRDSFKDIYPVTLFTSAALGYSAQSMFLGLIGMHKLPNNKEDGE
jgi:predicted membrane channel-forming protein YqfA (hemolysin III family)